MRDGNLLFDIPDWPVFTRYMSPIESKARARIRAIEKPIAVCGSTLSHLRVDSGDWVFGDMDGVVVIPAARVEDVLQKAEEDRRHRGRNPRPDQERRRRANSVREIRAALKRPPYRKAISMKNIVGIGHIAIRVKDIDRTLDFYRDKLGFKEMFRLDRDGKLWLMYLRVTDTQYIELFPGGGRRPRTGARGERR